MLRSWIICVLLQIVGRAYSNMTRQKRILVTSLTLESKENAAEMVGQIETNSYQDLSVIPNG